MGDHSPVWTSKRVKTRSAAFFSELGDTVKYFIPQLVIT